MMKNNDYELQVLLKELDHADKQICSYMNLQMKVLSVVFTLLAATLGLIFTKAGDIITSQSLANLLVIISAVGSFGIMQSVINFGIALGHMHNKQHFIAPRLQQLIGLSEPPLQALTAFQTSPSRAPVFLATATLAVCIFVFNAGVLWHAWCQSTEDGSLTSYLVVGAAAFLILTGACQVMIAIAMKKIGISHVKTGKPAMQT